MPNAHYWAFAHRVAVLGYLDYSEDLRAARSELLQRKPDFTCSFAGKRLFYVRNPEQLEIYIEGCAEPGYPSELTLPQIEVRFESDLRRWHEITISEL